MELVIIAVTVNLSDMSVPTGPSCQVMPSHRVRVWGYPYSYPVFPKAETRIAIRWLQSSRCAHLWPRPSYSVSESPPGPGGLVPTGP